MLAMVINALIIFKFAVTQRDAQVGGMGLALIAVVSFAAAAASARQFFVSQAAHTVSLVSSVRLVAFCCMVVCVIGMVTLLTR